MMGLFLGVRFVESSHLTLPGPDDWSRVRSPGRARRRLKRGFRQNIRPTQIPDPNLYLLRNGSYVGHPATIHKIREQASAYDQRQAERQRDRHRDIVDATAYGLGL